MPGKRLGSRFRLTRKSSCSLCALWLVFPCALVSQPLKRVAHIVRLASLLPPRIPHPSSHIPPVPAPCEIDRGRIRTCDLQLRRLSLYPLSYAAMGGLCYHARPLPACAGIQLSASGQSHSSPRFRSAGWCPAGGRCRSRLRPHAGPAGAAAPAGCPSRQRSH